MKPILGVFAVGLATTGWSTPQKIAHATRAQIEASLPAILKLNDRPDPAGEARYAKLEALGNQRHSPEFSKGLDQSATPAQRAATARLARPMLLELDRLLNGTLRKKIATDPASSFPKLASIKLLAKVVSLAANEAAGRKDARECEFYTLLGLRLGQRLRESNGLLIDLMVAEAVEAIGYRTVDVVDGKGGLDSAARAKALAYFAPGPDRSEVLADTLRREFRYLQLPLIIDPINGPNSLFADSVKLASIAGREKPKPSQPGSYDPIVTARLIGQIYAEDIQDVQRPYGAQKNLSAKLVAQAGKGLPTEEGSATLYAAKMNAIPNSIGRQLATITFSDPVMLAKSQTLFEAKRNVIRAVLLLRHDEPMNVTDPFGRGLLKVDRKRRLVWSVGPDGKDDGGQINGKDVGYPY